MDIGFVILAIVVMALNVLRVILPGILWAGSGATDALAHQQFMDEMNRQQQQQFMDEMNRQQQQQFMDFSMKNVTPFEHGGFNMDVGNSFNQWNGMF